MTRVLEYSINGYNKTTNELIFQIKKIEVKKELRPTGSQLAIP